VQVRGILTRNLKIGKFDAVCGFLIPPPTTAIS
jgi:hypothetical protein